MTAYDDIFSFRCLYYVDHVGHAYHSGILVENSIVLYLKIFSFSKSFINRVSFKHKRHFDAHIEADNIVVLDLT